MAMRYTHNYTYRIGPKVPHHGIANAPARRDRERERQRERPGGNPAADGPAETRAGALAVEPGQTQAESYNHRDLTL